MQKGDKFIRYSKDGATRGIVERIFEKKVYDLKNKVEVIKVMIKNTDGIVYDSNECYKIESELTLNLCQKIRLMLLRAKSKL